MLAQVKVYLNEGPDNYFGFSNEFANDPRLRLAAAFTLPLRSDDTETPLSELAVRRRLEYVFEQLNIGGDLVEATPWTERYRLEGNRSLSVGDVVVIGETAWSCEHAGWKQVLTEELVEAIVAFNEKGAAHR